MLPVPRLSVRTTRGCFYAEPPQLDLILRFVLGATTSLGFSYYSVPMPCYGHVLLSVAWPAGVYYSIAPRSGLLSVLFRCVPFMLLDHAQSHFWASEFS